MTHKDFYDIIFKRRSIRKYNLESVDDKTMEDILAFINTLTPMYEHIKVNMKIINKEFAKGLFPIKAPHYILITSESKEGYLTNAGFMIQQVDLFLSANNLGCCWVGMAQPKKEMTNESKLEYVIALAFGKPDENLHRENISEFKRKSIEEIRDNNQKDEIIEAARLAPSATNSQPWFFKIDNDKIHVYCVKSNFIKALIYKKMNQIDIGIAICHLWIAEKHFGKDISYVIDADNKENPPQGYYYITSLNIKE